MKCLINSWQVVVFDVCFDVYVVGKWDKYQSHCQYFCMDSRFTSQSKTRQECWAQKVCFQICLVTRASTYWTSFQHVLVMQTDLEYSNIGNTWAPFFCIPKKLREHNSPPPPQGQNIMAVASAWNWKLRPQLED